MTDADPTQDRAPDPAQDRIRQLESENARLRHLLDRQGMPGTLRHQVRNALGLMRAILRRSADSKTTVADFAAHLEGRFDALLRVQTALLSRPDGTIELAALVSDELLAQAVREGPQASIAGPEVRIDARRAELLGLVFHELTTNALSFGALARPEGRLSVSWTLLPERLLALDWVETAPAQEPPLQEPSRRGFGMEAIEAMLPYQLGGESTLAFRPEGLSCRFTVPLAAPSTASPSP